MSRFLIGNISFVYKAHAVMPFEGTAMFGVTKTILHEEEFYLILIGHKFFMHIYSCKPKDFTDMLQRVEWKCNGTKTRGF
jgi:hypothetical protein